MRNADIPMACVPEEYRKVFSTSNMMQPVASLEAVVKGSEGDSVREPWNPDFVAHFGQEIYEHMSCMQAWKVIPVGSIIGALDAVRNRILSFVIEIEAQDPTAGEAELNSNPVPKDKVHQIFNTYITGDVQNVATGSHDFEQHASKIENEPQVFSELLDALKTINAPEITEPLEASIESMRDTHSTDGFKGHYQKFMSLLADHMQVLGPVVAPFLPMLAAIIP